MNSVMFVKTVLNIAFRVDHVNDFIYLVGKSIAERDNFIILIHLMQKVL